jgi:hypothetical protein
MPLVTLRAEHGRFTHGYVGVTELRYGNMMSKRPQASYQEDWRLERAAADTAVEGIGVLHRHVRERRRRCHVCGTEETNREDRTTAQVTTYKTFVSC